MTWAYRWAARRKVTVAGKSATVLGVLILALAIPFGDHIVGYAYFSHLCRNESGTKIHRMVPDVEGMWWWAADGKTAQALGYRFIEGGTDPHRVTRYEIKGGGMIEHKDVPMASRYVFRSKTPEHIHMGIVRGRSTIEDLQLKEMLGETTVFQYRGGWLARTLLAGFGGSAGLCGTEIVPSKFITSVLQPIHGKR
jgi:hypothetical protein